MTPFCIFIEGSSFRGTGIYVQSMEYSPVIGGFSVVLSNGQASFLTATSLKFEPHVRFNFYINWGYIKFVCGKVFVLIMPNIFSIS